ncbi:glucosamine-6-phosphate deaminase [bacterium]|nr:glucosamine-6-phosphate deaminase [bacterium]
MDVIVKPSYEEVSALAARMIADVVEDNPRCVLGLATGSTPVAAYRELISIHKEQGLDFSQVVTFNLDEYVGLDEKNEQSYHYFMWENLFSHINIRPENVHIPEGNAEDVVEFCQLYEQMIESFGGIDLQLLGIGSNGHIAFNEPTGSLGSRTHLTRLTERTRRDNARFFKSLDEVPSQAMTMGIGTILDAASILLVANGESKAEAVAKMVEGPVTAMVPASALQLHPSVTVIVDAPAASKLTREYPSEPEML